MEVQCESDSLKYTKQIGDHIYTEAFVSWVSFQGSFHYAQLSQTS